MTGRADPSFDVPNILGGLRLRIVPALAAGAVAAVLTALAFAVLPNPYRGTLVLVPVQASRGGAGLSGVASSILGAGIDIPRGGFSATRDVVSYLLTSRTVLLAAAATEYQGRPVSVAVAGREPQPGKDELAAAQAPGPDPDHLLARNRLRDGVAAGPGQWGSAGASRRHGRGDATRLRFGGPGAGGTDPARHRPSGGQRARLTGADGGGAGHLR